MPKTSNSGITVSVHDSNSDPIPVRCYHAYGHTSLEEYTHRCNNYGGGVNPLGYKGHCFRADGTYGYQYKNGHTQNAQFSPRRTPAVKLASYDLGQDDEDILSMEVADHIIDEITAKKLAALQQVEEEIDMCHALLGPVWPLVPELEWVYVGCSTIFGSVAFLIWRVALLVMSIAALTTLTLFYPPSVATISVYCGFCFVLVKEIVFVQRIIMYDKQQPLPSYVWHKSFAIGVTALLFQVSVHMSFLAFMFVGNTYFFAQQHVSELALEFLKSPCVYVLMAVSVMQLFDMVVTPVPFRLGNVLIGVVIGSSGLMSFIGTSGANLVKGVSISLSASVALGILVHVVGRGLYIWIHELRLSKMALNAAFVTSILGPMRA